MARRRVRDVLHGVYIGAVASVALPLLDLASAFYAGPFLLQAAFVTVALFQLGLRGRDRESLERVGLAASLAAASCAGLYVWAPIHGFAGSPTDRVQMGGMIALVMGLILVFATYFAGRAGWALSPRRKREARTATGYCSRCNYDLSGLPPGSPCPECAAVPAPPVNS
jgi:hypothetical protein